MRRAFEKKSSSREILEAYRVAPSEELGLLYFRRREEEREASGLNALMDRFAKARAAGLDLNESDKTRLLALLLDDVLEGTMSQTRKELQTWITERHMRPGSGT